MQRLFAVTFASLFAVLLTVRAEAQSRLNAGRSGAHKVTCSERCQTKFTEAKPRAVCMEKCRAAGKR